MNLGKLNKTVILIDTDYLNQKIKENIEFYRDLYPEKKLNTLALYELIYKDNCVFMNVYKSTYHKCLCIYLVVY